MTFYRALRAIDRSRGYLHNMLRMAEESNNLALK
jgi:hypothetical protein